MLDRIKLSLNYLLPRKFLTELLGWIANKRIGWVTKVMIDVFVWYYNVDMTEAEKTDTAQYSTFNDFFARSLKENARPIDLNPKILIQPVDGIISQIGDIKHDQIFQAKKHFYSIESLLAGNYQMANKFINGKFVNIYIEPKNYHRIHMPCKGTLLEMMYVPGELYSVNIFASQNIPNIFARNERVICYFETDFGPLVQILIGATIVGSIETTWLGTISPPRKGIIQRWSWNEEKKIFFDKGEEIGRFKLGSTVINLYGNNKIKIFEHLSYQSKTFVGKPLAIAIDEIN